MKRTTITRSRFTIYTRTWWVSAIILFFGAGLSSCEDDPSTIGFRDDTNRFKVIYKELDVPSSVLLVDSVSTFNNPAFTDTRRLLIGRQWDANFGLIETEAYTQFRPYNPTYTFPTGSLLDSAVLNLTLDYYYYGDQSVATQEIFVHELTDSIITEQAYYFNSQVAYDPNPIGSSTISVNPTAFDTFLAANRDNDATNNRIDTISITLDKQRFAQNLFDAAVSSSSEYREFRSFRRQFKGLAIRSEGDQKIIGINPFNDSNPTALARSRIILYFRIPDPNNTGQFLKRSIDFTLLSLGSGNSVMGFSSIDVDRQGTPLAGLEEFFKEFVPSNNMRYVQAGAAVVTKIDLSSFKAFTDTIPNFVVNSAELFIAAEEQSLPLPRFLGLRVLKSNNRFRFGSEGIPTYYNGLFAVDNSGFLLLGERLNASVLSTNYNLELQQSSTGTNTYQEYFTAFFQRLYSFRDEQVQFLNFALFPTSPEIGKSVNGFSFKADNIKLRLFYTIPSTTNQE